MKWVDSLLEQEFLFQHHDPSVALDKRKLYILPSRHLTQSWYEYVRQRILLTAAIGKTFDDLYYKIKTCMTCDK